MVNLNREQAYDDLISPLMKQVINLCMHYDIPIFATFQIDNRADTEPLFCTTAIIPDGSDKSLKKIYDIIAGHVKQDSVH